MISLTKGFAFIHINKTGGTSINEALAEFEDPTQEKVLKDHSLATCYRSVLSPALWDEMWSFGIVRNPFDRMVSAYEYRRQILESNETSGPAKSLSFKEWLKQDVLPHTNNRYVTEWQSQTIMLSDETGIIVDDVYLYENLDQAWEEIQKKIGIQRELPRLNMTERPHWSSYYDDESKAIVRGLYQEDFEWAEATNIVAWE